MNKKNNTMSGEDLIEQLKTSPSHREIKLLRENVTWWLMLHCFE
jgi:hypothetical protein